MSARSLDEAQRNPGPRRKPLNKMCHQGSPWIPLRSIQPTISGCVLVGGSTTFYQCGSAWIKPVFGANGVYYKVVPAP